MRDLGDGLAVGMIVSAGVAALVAVVTTVFRDEMIALYIRWFL